jgi:hypothetical protein
MIWVPTAPTITSAVTASRMTWGEKLSSDIRFWFTKGKT